MVELCCSAVFVGMVVGGRGHFMVSPTCWTPFSFGPIHAWPVWCWPACVWSVYGHIVAAAVVSLVPGRFSHLMAGLFGVGSLALQQALAKSDVCSRKSPACFGVGWGQLRGAGMVRFDCAPSPYRGGEK